MSFGEIFERIRRLVSSAPEFPEFLDEWDDQLDDQMPHWGQLTDSEQERLETLTLHYMNEWNWEATQGFTLTTEMIVLIAASAALIVLELPFDAYASMRTVVVSETTMILDQERAGPGGPYRAVPSPRSATRANVVRCFSRGTPCSRERAVATTAST